MKKLKSVLITLVAVSIYASLISCSQVTNNPSPSITTISPDTATVGGTGFTMTVNGHGFAPQSVITFNGIARAGNTLFLSEQQVTTLINPSDIADQGQVMVGVTTPAPGGGNSNLVTFTIVPGQSQTPQVLSTSPSSTFAGGTALSMTVYGTNFNSSSVVALSNANLPTLFVNNGQLDAVLSSTNLETAGVFQVSVTNPPPGGGASNAVTFTITNPPPSISTIAPSTIAVPSGTNDGTTVTVSGQGFDMASQVYFNGNPRTTTFLTQFEVTAALNPSDIATGGTFPVTVVNPAPGGGISNPAGFSAIAQADGLGLPSQVNVATTGVQGNAGTTDTTTSGPVISSNGQYMAFASAATNLILGDTNNVADVFEYNSCLATTSVCTPSTIDVSVSNVSTLSNGASSEPSMDNTGRYLTFTSTATNLIPNNYKFTGSKEVYWRDTCSTITTTCNPFTILVSVTSDGTGTPANSDSFQSSISPDGRYVAFTSAATNLGNSLNPGGIQQVFLFDTCLNVTGCTTSMSLVSLATDGSTPGNAASSTPMLGNNGLYVAFASSATNLVSSQLPGTQQIFLRSTCIGISSCNPATSLMSIASDGSAANGISFEPAMSAEGRVVAFASNATNLTSDITNGVQEVFQRDACTGVSGCTPATTLVSIGLNGVPGNAASEHPSVSGANGGVDQYVAFASFANNLVANDTNNQEDVFVRNTCTGASGCTQSTVLNSISASQNGSAGVQGNAASLAPVISGDNHSVSFISAATNLLPYPVNIQNNVFFAYTQF